MIAGFDRYFQIAPCFRDEDARADRSPGEFYQLDIEMSFVTQDDVFNAVEPGAARRVRGVRGRQAGDAEVSAAFRTRRRCANYGSDKPDLRNPIKMQNVSEAFRGSGFKIFANILAADAKNEVWAIPAPTGGNRAFCDRMNSWAQGRRAAGARLHLLARRRGERRGADRQEHRAGAHQADRRSAWHRRRRRLLLRRRQSEGLREVRRPRAHQGRRGAEPRQKGSVHVLLDRRLPDVRVERGGEEDRLLAQSVLHAEHGAGGSSSRSTRRTTTRSLDTQGDPVRHRLQRHRAVLGRDPEPRPDMMIKAFEIAGYGGRRAGGEVRRHAERASATARRRMAASRPASTASSCCCAARRTCARSCCSR